VLQACDQRVLQLSEGLIGTSTCCYAVFTDGTAVP